MRVRLAVSVEHLAETLGIPGHTLTKPVPTNDAEMVRAFLKADVLPDRKPHSATIWRKVDLLRYDIPKSLRRVNAPEVERLVLRFC